MMGGDNKIRIYNPFTALSKENAKKFYTYTLIQGIPNDMLTYKIQIISPGHFILKETDANTTMVNHNLLTVKTLWSNISFNEVGNYMLQVLIKCNNQFEAVGGYIFIQHNFSKTMVVH